MELLAIDHVGIYARDLAKTYDFYTRLFGGESHRVDYAPDGPVIVRQMKIGGVVLSIHQHGHTHTEHTATQQHTGTFDFCIRCKAAAVALIGTTETARD